MEQCLMNYYILDDELRNTCDFNTEILKDGKGIYEVFRVINGVPLFLNEHFDRYYQSLELAGLKPNHSRNQLITRLKTLIEINRLKKANIQFQHLQIHSKEVFLAWVAPTIYPTLQDYKNGVDLLSLNAVRDLPQLKSLNLPAREKANKILAEEDIFEVLLIDDDGIITEGSRSNIFFVKNNQLFTSLHSLILEGITRSKVISVAGKAGIEVTEKFIPFNSIGTFDSTFLTSTSMKVLPVKKIDNVLFNTDNQLVNRLKMLFDQLIIEDLNSFNWQKIEHKINH